MIRATFSPEIEAAIAAGWTEHNAGRCQTDCGFCEDLRLSGLPSAAGELKRIHQLRQKPKPLPTPGKVGKGTKSPLASRLNR